MILNNNQEQSLFGTSMIPVFPTEEEHQKAYGHTLPGDDLTKGEPPGPPPRPGLQWKEESSRWIRPDKEMTPRRVSMIQTPQRKYKDKFDLFLQQEKFRKVLPDLANSAPRNTEALIKYLTEHIPENASKFAAMAEWLNGYSKLAMDHQNVSNAEVDKLFKQGLKVGEYAIKAGHGHGFAEPFVEAQKDPTRLNKVIAIDSFAHFMHDRGSVLPHLFEKKLVIPEGEHPIAYEYSVVTELDDIVAGIMDELAARANMLPETKSAGEGLRRYIQQTRSSSYGKQDLNEWVNRKALDIGVDMLDERKASEVMPDPYSIEFYDWVEKKLEIGGHQIRGVKHTGTQLEVDLYDSLKKACNNFLDTVAPGTPQHEIIHGLGDVIEKWTRDMSITMSEAFDMLYKSGFYAGVIDTGVHVTMSLADELALRLLKTDPNRLGGKIRIFSKDIVNRYQKIISEAYTPEGKFWLPGMIKEMREVVPAQRYQLERIVRTEVASISNAGRLLGWSEDQNKYFYDYIWNNVYDNRSKFVSIWRGNQNPCTFDEIKFLWEHQGQILNGHEWHDEYNQRCSLSRIPIEFERKGNRWEGDGTFIMTLSLGF